MRQPIQLVVPMSGQGHRYRKEGYVEPKPLVPVSGVPMVERVLAGFPAAWPATFVLAGNHRDTPLPALLERLRPGAAIRFIAPHALGPGRALADAVLALPPDAPVFVSYCDYGMAWDAARFERFVRETACDACVVSYRGFHAHYLSPVTYAYSRLDGERVVEVREKGSFTADREAEYASAGGYYFRTAALLQAALEAQVALGLAHDGELYTSLTVEALLRSVPGAHVRVFEIDAFFQWGTPDDLRDFEYWERTFTARNRASGRRGKVDQVLMPMAGRGSRFASVSRHPKPLIPVAGRPMYRAALDALPEAGRTVLVALDDIAAGLPRPDGTRVVPLPQTPPGQALSTEAGLVQLDPAREVLVAACDHALVLHPDRWEAFRADPACDAAIFTVRGLPAAARSPASFAWVVPEPGDAPFPVVERVSVRVPVSAQPRRDAVLVGSFWFASAAVLARGIDQLRRRDLRVNGELYLDSVFALLAEAGLRVRSVPLDGCVSWGDPDSLAEALYWAEVFGGRRPGRRGRFPGVNDDA